MKFISLTFFLAPLDLLIDTVVWTKFQRYSPKMVVTLIVINPMVEVESVKNHQLNTSKIQKKSVKKSSNLVFFLKANFGGRYPGFPNTIHSLSF